MSFQGKEFGIIFGPNGSGKGTLAHFLEQNLKYTHINTGSLIRQYVNEHQLTELKEHLDNGEMLDDLFVEKILINHFKSHAVSHSHKIILEGIPRRKSQISTIQHICKFFQLKISWIVVLDLELEVILERIKDRVLAPDGNVYHKVFNPPPKYFKESDLIQRPDDRPHVVQKRYNNYLENTLSCIQDPFFQGIPTLHVDAKQSIQEILKKVEEWVQGGFGN